MPTISECIFTISEVTYLSLQNSDFFTTLHLESMHTVHLKKILQWLYALVMSSQGFSLKYKRKLVLTESREYYIK